MSSAKTRLAGKTIHYIPTKFSIEVVRAIGPVDCIFSSGGPFYQEIVSLSEGLANASLLPEFLLPGGCCLLGGLADPHIRIKHLASLSILTFETFEFEGKLKTLSLFQKPLPTANIAPFLQVSAKASDN